MASSADPGARPMSTRMALTPGMQALAWALTSFFGFVTIPSVLVWPIGQIQQAADLPLHLTLAGWAFIWVVASGLWALAAARLALGQWCAVSRTAWLVLGSGAIVAAAQIALLAMWTIGRYGYNEADFVGPTSLLFAAVAAVAVAGFGVQVAPRLAIWSPLICVALGVVLAVTILIENLPGLGDGIASDSVGLAIVTGMSAAYVVTVGAACFRRARHRSTLAA